MALSIWFAKDSKQTTFIRFGSCFGSPVNSAAIDRPTNPHWGWLSFGGRASACRTNVHFWPNADWKTHLLA